MSAAVATARAPAGHLSRRALLAAALLASCSPETDSASAPAAAAPSAATALDVELAGCASFLASGLCEIEQGSTLRLWIGTSERAGFTITVDGRPAAPRCAPVQEGHACAVPVDAGASELVVTAREPDARPASFRAPLARSTTLPAFETADALRRRGELEAAEEALSEAERSPDPVVRARALGLLARIRLAGGRTDEAEELFRDAIDLDRANGRASNQLSNTVALTRALARNGRRFADVRAALDGLAPLIASYPEGAAKVPYYMGILSFETGDLRAASRLFAEAAARAERLGMEVHRLAVTQALALVLQALGRADEGAALVRGARDALPAGVDACARVELLCNLGWLALHAGEAEQRSASAERAFAPLGEALSTARATCARHTPSVLADLALAHLHRGDLQRARELVDEARRPSPPADPALSARLLDIEGRLALAAGNGQAALDLHERLARLAADSASPSMAWQAAVGRAQAFELLKQTDRAIAAHAEADALLDARSLLVPLGEGRETFLARFEEGPRMRVDLLLRERPQEAARVARQSRARTLAALAWVQRRESLSPAERSRWEEALDAYHREREAHDRQVRGSAWLPADALRSAVIEAKARDARLRSSLEEALSVLGGAAAERAAASLPAPAPGELLLVYHPIRRSWAGFAVEGDEVAARALGALPDPASPVDLSSALLEPFRDAIERAARVRILAYGSLDRVDFHALPWNGAPLLAHAAVSYGVDVPASPRAGRSAPEDRAEVTLVVADPRSDLPGARAEADVVSSALRSRGSTVLALAEQSASYTPVRSGLSDPRASLFHYAGHGVHRGHDGWESGLALSDGGWLTVGDVLASSRVPPLVVLSACDGARTAPGARAEGIGLAQAFVVAGARAVIAATRPVGSDLTGELMRALYRAPLRLESPDAAVEALREAQLAVAEADPRADWASFRVLVP